MSPVSTMPNSVLGSKDTVKTSEMSREDSEDDYEMDDEDEGGPSAKRIRIQEGATKAATDFGNATTQDEKLRLIFEVSNDTNLRVKTSEVKVQELKRKVKVLEEREVANKKKISELEEKVKFLLDGGPCNVILHGVTEVKDEDPIKVALDILKKTGKVAVGIKKAFRLGKKDDVLRPIKIKLKSLDDKETVLAAIPTIRNYNKQNATKYHVFADTTLSERLQRKEAKAVFDQIKTTDPDATLRRGIITSKGTRIIVDSGGKITKEAAKLSSQ